MSGKNLRQHVSNPSEVNGLRLKPDGKILRFEPVAGDPKRGVITCQIDGLPSPASRGTTRLAVQCDDFAVDDAALRVELVFTVTAPPAITLDKPNAIAPGGVKIFCDSVHQGYENVECLIDGELQTPGTTTYGCTWASEETAVDHWVCFVMPKPRSVSGVSISWANYKDTFWTSDRYDLMIWDGSNWQRALRVQQNPPARTSKHTFTPRQTDRVLIWVPAEGNHPERPKLAWMTEVELK